MIYRKSNLKKKSFNSSSKTYKKKYVRRTPSLAVKKYVKKELHRNIENKTEQVLSAQNTISSYNASSSLFTVSCIPYSAILNGATQGERIANEIRTRKCMFNYVLRPQQYIQGAQNSTPQPQEVIIFFGKVKNSKPQQPISTDYAKLWQAGDSYHAPYSNGLDLIQDVNKDWFTVYKICRHKIGFSQYNTAGMSPSWEYYNNNDFKLNVCRKINLTKYCPKVLKFNDTTLQPTNDGLWCWAMCVNADGSLSTATSPVQMDFTVNYTYEDA